MTKKFRDKPTGGIDARRPVGHDSECGRAEEVVAYLYGETTDKEAARFTQHLAACAACRDEVAAFGVVREGIGEWRAEAVRLTPSLGMSDAISPTPEFAKAQPRRRSARAALGEFFALSPRWMQAGTAAAAIVLCVLAALSFARAEVRWDESGIALNTGARNSVEKTNEAPITNGVTQSQVDEMITNHAREVGALRQELQQKEASLIAARQKLSDAERMQPQTVTASSRERRRRNTRVPASRTPDSYLAGNSEEDLPRLYDLLRDVN
ncbi:MAG TPA: zf-HC2 domain-containing protein [Pyrinomonadaceae bacterium]|jgi:anti-sigma factor RsiW|nr:zf-HC2 domain-containing protein [Pyrinomonadaceae bacterium]